LSGCCRDCAPGFAVYFVQLKVFVSKSKLIRRAFRAVSPRVRRFRRMALHSELRDQLIRLVASPRLRAPRLGPWGRSILLRFCAIQWVKCAPKAGFRRAPGREDDEISPSSLEAVLRSDSWDLGGNPGLSPSGLALAQQRQQEQPPPTQEQAQQPQDQQAPPVPAPQDSNRPPISREGVPPFSSPSRS
jgi:hypothetical protein